MFDFIKNIFKKKNKTISPIIDNKEPIQPKNILKIEKKENLTTIEIIDDCTLQTFSNNLEDHDIMLPIRILIKDGNDLFTATIKKQKIYILKNDQYKYLIAMNNSAIKISQRESDNECIYETCLQLKTNNKEFKLTKYIHDLNHSTKSVKWFPQEATHDAESFKLDKKEAYASIYHMLTNLEKANLEAGLSLRQIYDFFDFVSEDNYYPLISDEEITLSWPCRFGKTDLNDSIYENLDIILNQTQQIVGNIGFHYSNKSESYYGYAGNVNYYIKDEFRGNHYATKALNLLKQLLKTHTFKGDKDLYISTTPENIASQKVIENNGGELIYKGDVAKDESIYIIDKVKKVNVYKIKM